MALTLQDILPGLINAGGAYYGAQQNVGNLQGATARSASTPTNLQTNVGSASYSPAGGFNVNAPAPTGAFAGASPELIAALQGLTNTDAETQNRLSQLRAMAAPAESLAGNKALDNIFRLGQLGGTGGAVQQEAFANSILQADRGRQLDAADWAQQRATTRFQGALQTVGSGQAQQSQDLARVLGLGNLSRTAVTPPDSALAAATAGAQDARNQGVYGALSEGLAGLLGQSGEGSTGILGSLRNILGGGSSAAGAGGAGGALAGAGALGAGAGALGQVLGGASLSSMAAGGAGSAGLAGITGLGSGTVAGATGGMSGALAAGAGAAPAGAAAGGAGAAGASGGGLGTLGTIGAGLGLAAGAAGAYEGIRTGNEGMAALGAGVGAASAGALAGLSGLAALGPIGLAAAGVAALGASMVTTKEFGDVALRNYWNGVDSGRNIGESDPTELAQGFINYYRTNKNSFPGQAVYGRTGNEDFLYDMQKHINGSIEGGRISANATPGEIYEHIVKPWVSSMGPGPTDEKAAAVQDFMMTDLINSYMQGKPISNAQIKGDSKFAIVSQPLKYPGTVQPNQGPPPATPTDGIDWASLGLDPNNPFAGLGLQGF